MGLNPVENPVEGAAKENLVEKAVKDGLLRGGVERPTKKDAFNTRTNRQNVAPINAGTIMTMEIVFLDTPDQKWLN